MVFLSLYYCWSVKFFLYPSRLLFEFYCCLSLPSQGGIPPPSGGIVSENPSTRNQTTIMSKRVGPLGSNGAPLLGSNSVILYWCFNYDWLKLLKTGFKLKCKSLLLQQWYAPKLCWMTNLKHERIWIEKSTNQPDNQMW